MYYPDDPPSDDNVDDDYYYDDDGDVDSDIDNSSTSGIKPNFGETALGGFRARSSEKGKLHNVLG